MQSNIIEPAIKGTLDLLKSCLNSGTVKRVVFTSSISTLTAKDSKGNARAVVDEYCQTPVDQVLSEKANGWVMLPLPLILYAYLKIAYSIIIIIHEKFYNKKLFDRFMDFQRFSQRKQHLDLQMRMTLIWYQ